MRVTETIRAETRGDWNYLVVRLGDGRHGVAWVGCRPMVDGSGRVVCPSASAGTSGAEELAGDETGLRIHPGREAAMADFEAMMRALEV